MHKSDLEISVTRFLIINTATKSFFIEDTYYSCLLPREHLCLAFALHTASVVILYHINNKKKVIRKNEEERPTIIRTTLTATIITILKTNNVFLFTKFLFYDRSFFDHFRLAIAYTTI